MSSDALSTTPQDDVWTIGRLLTWTTEHLKKCGTDNPRLDTEVLLAHACGYQRIDLYTKFGDVADNEVRTVFRELVRRRAAGTPVAYLVGHREFYSLSFKVTPDVLIPRPETEFLVLTLLDLVQRSNIVDRSIDVADVGTGSGVIAVCAAKHVEKCRVTAVDLSPSALKVARSNASNHDVSEQIDFVESDLLSALPSEPQFDFIVSNPPYITEHEYANLPSDVRDFEPRLALVAGPNGVEVIERLLVQSSDRLRENGWLLLEISPMLVEAVCGLIKGNSRFESPSIVKDLAGLARVVSVRRSS